MPSATQTFEEQIKHADVGFIVEEGKRIYEQVKDQYLPEHKGEFLAINPKTGDVYLGESSTEAGIKARTVHPNTIFYLVRVGYDVAEWMSSVRV